MALSSTNVLIDFHEYIFMAFGHTADVRITGKNVTDGKLIERTLDRQTPGCTDNTANMQTLDRKLKNNFKIHASNLS